MHKDFIIKFTSGLSLALMTSCGTVNTFVNWTVPSSQTQDISVLSNVSLANSRDIIIKLKPNQQINSLQQLVPITHISRLSPELGLYKLTLKNGHSLLQNMQILNQSQQVEYAEPNVSFHLPDFQVQQSAVQPNDPNYGLQWNMKSAKIDQAWSLVNSNPQIKVAVIDSGVDPDHPDLVDALEPLEDIYNEEKGSDVYRVPSTGELINFGGRDGNGHGTHVTGIIAATMNNGIGVTGVVGGGVRIIPIKATDYAGNTDAATLTAAFQRAIDKGANLINISIGGPASKGTRAFIDVINRALDKNISIVSATGNDSARNEGVIAPLAVPAAYPRVIAVGAHTEFNKVASYSNGGEAIDLIAPGGGPVTSKSEGPQVWSTWPSYNTFLFYQKKVLSTYNASNAGTSMACPHVTGVVALILAREPGLTPAQIRSRLIATADDMGAPGFDEDSGYGKLNALRALQWTAHDAHD
jgi:serine protease